MKLIGPVMSPVLPLNERLAQQLTIAGQALIEAAAVLRGKPASGFAPGGPRTALGSSTWLTVIELVNEFLMAKARADSSDRYLRQLKVSLCSFANGRARHPITEVRAPDLEKWIRSHDWAPRTCRGYLGDVKTLVEGEPIRAAPKGRR